MADSDQSEPYADSFFANPVVGTTLTVLSGLSFLFVCMIVPLVGKAAYLTDRYAQNRFWFTIALLVALALSVLATVSKLARRKIDQSPLPLFSIVLTAACVLFIGALLLNTLHV